MATQLLRKNLSLVQSILAQQCLDIELNQLAFSLKEDDRITKDECIQIIATSDKTEKINLLLQVLQQKTDRATVKMCRVLDVQVLRDLLLPKLRMEKYSWEIVGRKRFDGNHYKVAKANQSYNTRDEAVQAMLKENFSVASCDGVEGYVLKITRDFIQNL